MRSTLSRGGEEGGIDLFSRLLGKKKTPRQFHRRGEGSKKKARYV